MQRFIKDGAPNEGLNNKVKEVMAAAGGHQGFIGDVTQELLNRGIDLPTILAFLMANMPALIKIAEEALSGSYAQAIQDAVAFALLVDFSAPGGPSPAPVVVAPPHAEEDKF